MRASNGDGTKRRRFRINKKAPAYRRKTCGDRRRLESI